MFKQEMAEKLKLIFGFRKTTYDAVGSSGSTTYEQDTLFIDIEKVKSNASFGKVSAKISGTLTVYSENNKLPYGFFNKRIGQSKADLTKQFFFYNFDQDIANSPARIQNINERRLSFIYLYEAQYDPDQGELTSLSFGEPVYLNQNRVDSGYGNLIDTGEGILQS